MDEAISNVLGRRIFTDDPASPLPSARAATKREIS
jgi:hypothetical protein